MEQTNTILFALGAAAFLGVITYKVKKGWDKSTSGGTRRKRNKSFRR